MNAPSALFPAVSPLSALRRLTTAVALAMGAVGSAQAQGLLEIYDAALGFDATLQSARMQYEANLAKAEQAHAGLRPQAGLSAGTQWANVDTSIQPASRAANSQSVALSASQPLYRPANRLTSEQGTLSVDVAKAQLQVAEQDLIVRTTQAYFDVLAAQDTLTFVQAQKAAVAEQLASAKRNFEVGTSTVTDSREAQARYDLVLAQEIAAESDLRVKKLALDLLVGKTGTAPKPLVVPVALPALDPANPDAWVAQAERQHPAILQAEKGYEIAQLETRKADAGHKPTLDLVGQYQVARGPSSSQPALGNFRTNTASVGLQFNLPLFAGYAIQNRVKETLALEEKARSDRETVTRNVIQATRSAYFGVLSGQGQVKALEAAEASSQSALEANQLGYQVGVRINIDVLNAQSQLFQTKRDLAQARYNVLLGGLRLKQASGSLTVDDLRAVDALLAR
ncbi:MAG: channel protein TolC [Burkholderiales bacterium RIFCSPLOWO2_12_67_14]|nr:MAG: channel protein TolC [Burkholderiales bacterium RIFCSPLOWO2_02_FULL_67_64]OGB37534.1 MAG: channel protein TolC [Burkholderiales bacterium RIFCSPHIGHO2_12_FULL_67_38]OGB40057.1 MAG: channel protein TolC [Burkholderiales bacterium RIFCSPLOWO2_12_67_14]